MASLDGVSVLDTELGDCASVGAQMTPREALEEATPFLRQFEAALKDGTLVICAQCWWYEFAASAEQMGECKKYPTEAQPFVPFKCEGFERRPKRTA